MYYKSSQGLTNESHFKYIYSVWQREWGSVNNLALRASLAGVERSPSTHHYFTPMYSLCFAGNPLAEAAESSGFYSAGGWRQRNNAKEGVFYNLRAFFRWLLWRQSWKPAGHWEERDVGDPRHEDDQYLKWPTGGHSKGPVPGKANYTNILRSQAG